MKMSFTYQKLNRPDAEFRLIRFLRNDNNPQEVFLETVSKEDNPTYHCLSYVWGDPAKVWPLIVNGALIHVTHNLGEALKRLQDEAEVRLLWVDALCINQGDAEEVKCQIRRMDSIYSDAKSVLAWLGPESGSLGEIMDEIGKVGGITIRRLLDMPILQAHKEELAAATKLSPHKTALGMLREIPSLIGLDGAAGRRLPPVWNEIGWEHSEHRRPISDWDAFFSRPYWKRVWILQELSTAREAYLLLGVRKEPLRNLLALFQILHGFAMIGMPKDILTWLFKMHRSFLAAPIISCLVQIGSAGTRSRMKMLDLLHLSRNMESTIPQDRIFGLLALTTDEDRLHIEIDYSKTLHEHLEDITRYTFLRHGIVLRATSTALCPWAVGAPSWVVADRKTRSISHVRFIRDLFFQLYYLDSGTRNLTMEPDAWGRYSHVTMSKANFPSRNILRLHSHLIGVVNRHQNLDVTDVERDQIRVLLDKVLPPDTSFNRNDAFSCLEAASQLKKLASFLHKGSAEDLMQMTVDAVNYQHRHGDRQLWQLLICHSRKRADVSEDIYLQYNEALYLGFCILCRLAEGEEGIAGLGLISTDTKEVVDGWHTIKKVSQLYAACLNTNVRRSVFETKEGYIGVSSMSVQAGDCLTILPGVGAPYIARPAKQDKYLLIEEAYVLGIMNNELFDGTQDPEPTWMEFS